MSKEDSDRIWDQMNRIVSDIESEKGTRRRASEYYQKRLDEIDRTLRNHERLLYAGIGGLAVLEIILRFLIK